MIKTNRLLVIFNTLLATILVLVLVQFAPSVSNAASTTIVACADKKSGDLRIAYKECTKNENKVSWGQTGARGAAGKKGETGAQGPAGAQGATGATGAQGPAGATGSQGATGATGPAGTSPIIGASATGGALLADDMLGSLGDVSVVSLGSDGKYGKTEITLASHSVVQVTVTLQFISLDPGSSNYTPGPGATDIFGCEVFVFPAGETRNSPEVVQIFIGSISSPISASNIVEVPYAIAGSAYLLPGSWDFEAICSAITTQGRQVFADNASMNVIAVS